MIDITFKKRADQKLAQDERLAQKKLGKACAQQLRNRLADLRAAQVVTDLIAGHPHPLVGDRAGEFAVTLNGGTRLVFAAANEPVPKTEDGSVNWKLVTKVHVTFIGDYHD